MKVCIAGKNEIATACTEWLLINDLIKKEDLLVCTNKTDTGVDGFQRSFKKYAKQNKLLIVNLREIYSVSDLFFFSLEFDQLIRPDLFSSSKLYNIHFSLLPKYKGVYTSAWPILNGERSTGVTLHEIDQGIDTGNVIDQIEIIIEDSDNCRDLYFKYTSYGISLFKKNFISLIKGDYTSKKQPAFGSSYYSKSSIDYSNITIDLNKTAIEIRNQLRAFTFEEYQLPIVYSFVIGSSEILESVSWERPGTVLSESESSIVISTIDYDLRLFKKKSNARSPEC